jgi:hypothetical protein
VWLQCVSAFALVTHLHLEEPWLPLVERPERAEPLPQLTSHDGVVACEGLGGSEGGTPRSSLARVSHIENSRCFFEVISLSDFPGIAEW